MKRFAMRVCMLAFACLGGLAICRADELAAVTGLVTDPNGRSVPGVTVLITNLSTNVASRTVTNDQGIYRVSALQPGIYRMTIDKDGFKSIVKSGIELHVQDVASINFELQIGSVNETVTVKAGGLVINTTDGSVSTVVDRQFVENIPLNGRSFQSLITLTPGVVQVPSLGTNGADGQFSVNGQRADANYFVVDGVSANVANGVGIVPGQASSGSLPGVAVSGLTQSLASVDAMQEFRIQTSTYSAEYGRTPGGQISIITRSGTNQFHGSVFDYFRNEAMDANDWFSNRAGIPRPPERQNDFGGVFGGPLIKDRTFFFVSYEGLRLQTPKFLLTNVPTMTLRQSAPAAMQPILNAFPLPNGRDLGNGLAEYAIGYSDPTTVDATSVRVDHTFRHRVTIFARYSGTPSSGSTRWSSNLSDRIFTNLNNQLGTLGSTITLSPAIVDELRVNYTTNGGDFGQENDTFGGAVPVPRTVLLPSQYAPAGTPSSGGAQLNLKGFTSSSFPQVAINNLSQSQSQFNLLDNVSYGVGSHRFKFGVDYRRLAPVLAPRVYALTAQFRSQTAILNASPTITFISAGMEAKPIFMNFSSFAQDTWKVSRRLSLDLGLRWDLNPAPKEANGKDPFSVMGFSDLATMQLAPQGTSLWNTTYNNFAPRVGAAYLVRQSGGSETVIRGGFGVFYDTGNNQGAQGYGGWPFTPSRVVPGLAFPLDPSKTAPPAFTVSPPYGVLSVSDPHLTLPYTLQWNFAIQQSLGQNQTLTASYVGAVGRRLLQTRLLDLTAINPNFTFIVVTANHASSDYDALQVQFQRRLSRGLQALASYTWSHAIDDTSADSGFDSFTGFFAPQRGNSAFDTRHNLQAAITYDIPAPRLNRVASALFGHWSADTRISAQSALPVNISSGSFSSPADGSQISVSADVVPGIPQYLNDSTVSGGRRINSAAFSPVPTGPNGIPTRQGTLGRDVLRGFGAWQMDFALRKQFNLSERFNLQFRGEAFNVFNHPNFGAIQTNLQSPNFGQATNMWARQLGGLIPLYQIGGPRSLQVALKLAF